MPVDNTKTVSDFQKIIADAKQVILDAEVGIKRLTAPAPWRVGTTLSNCRDKAHCVVIKYNGLYCVLSDNAVVQSPFGKESLTELQSHFPFLTPVPDNTLSFHES